MRKKLTLKESTAAERRATRADCIVLSERDTARVLKLLEKPPKPTPALRAAARRRIEKKNVDA